jgi:hypothetical protein
MNLDEDNIESSAGVKYLLSVLPVGTVELYEGDFVVLYLSNQIQYCADSLQMRTVGVSV